MMDVFKNDLFAILHKLLPSACTETHFSLVLPLKKVGLGVGRGGENRKEEEKWSTQVTLRKAGRIIDVRF